MLAIAQQAAGWNTSLIVINPNPIDWKAKTDKNDRELTVQLGSLTSSPERFTDIGLKLCYHTHDAEMRASAREFHHMLTASDPETVRLCLDPHWILRGAGNSEIALHDIITHYGDASRSCICGNRKGGLGRDGRGRRSRLSRLGARIDQMALIPCWCWSARLKLARPPSSSDVEAHRQSAVFSRGIFARTIRRSAPRRLDDEPHLHCRRRLHRPRPCGRRHVAGRHRTSCRRSERCVPASLHRKFPAGKNLRERRGHAGDASLDDDVVVSRHRREAMPNRRNSPSQRSQRLAGQAAGPRRRTTPRMLAAARPPAAAWRFQQSLLGLCLDGKGALDRRLGSLGRDLSRDVCHRRARMRSGIEYQPETRWFLDRSKSGGGS